MLLQRAKGATVPGWILCADTPNCCADVGCLEYPAGHLLNALLPELHFLL